MPSPNSPITNSPSHTNGGANGHSRFQNSYIPITAPPVQPTQEDDFELSKLAAILKRRAGLFLGIVALSFGGLTYRFLNQPPVYSGSASLLVEPVTAPPSVSLGAPQPFLLNSARGSGLDYTSQIQVLRSPAVLEPIVEKIQQRHPEMTYNRLLGRLRIAQEEESKVLLVSYSDVDPKVAAFVLTQVVDGFINYSVEDRQGDLRRGLTFLDQQLQEKWQEVSTIEGNLSQFQKQHNLVDVGATSASVTERMNQMLAQQENLRVQFASQESLYENLRYQVGFDPDTAIRVANLNESPNYQTLLGQLRQLEQTIATESARFQVDTPIIEALEDQRQQLLPLLDAEAQRLVGATLDADTLGYQGTVSLSLMQQLVDTANQMKVLQTQEQALGRAVQQLQAEIQGLADLSRSYQQISRELAVAESSLTQLLTNRQNMRLQMAQQVSPWELISPLNDSTIAKVSTLPRNLLFSTVVSLLLGGSVALLRDRLDQVFHSAKDLADFTKLPNLAMVPNAPSLEKQPLLIAPDLSTTMADGLTDKAELANLHTSFSFAEAFYALDANLRLLSSDDPIQVVAITSSEPGEGKSTICAHLAIAAANMGRRVLLVDGDLRKPTQHRLFGLPNGHGLSDLLTQQSESWADWVNVIPGNTNLHLVTAGARPPSPGRLLSSRKMQQITEHFRSRYDLIVFDTPPLSRIIDAKLTAANVDGLLLAVRLRKSHRADVQRVLLDLGNTSQAPLLGVVVNGVSVGRHRHGYEQYYR
jgi:capsular exopolysaccharide synthesis family protein